MSILLKGLLASRLNFDEEKAVALTTHKESCSEGTYLEWKTR